MVATFLFMSMPKGLNSPQSTSLDPRFTATRTAEKKLKTVVLTIAAADSAKIREDRTDIEHYYHHPQNGSWQNTPYNFLFNNSLINQRFCSTNLDDL